MWAISTSEAVEKFANQRSIVSTYIATGYDQDVTEWMFKSVEQFNFDFGSRWHLLVPIQSPEPKATLLTHDHRLGVDLSMDLLDRYSISRQHVPVIVFDNFDEQEQQLYVSLKKADQSQLRTFMEDAVSAIEKHEDQYLGSPSQYRKAVIADIYDRCQMKSALKKMVQWTPYVGSLFRASTAISR